MKNEGLLALALLVGAQLLGGCEPEELITNPLVDRWCGERPCGWEVEGKIERVGTWHDNDYAASLSGKHVVLSQLNAMATESIECIEFSMLTKIQGDADVYLELDFLDDGEPEFSRRLRKTDFESVGFKISTPTWYQGVRFIIRKEGSGTAIIARLRAQSSSDCTGAPLELDARPLSAYCEDDDECASGMCEDALCVECRSSKDCMEGDACSYGITEAIQHVAALTCVQAASQDLGEACLQGDSCKSGICCGGTCSECCSITDCPDDAECAFSAFVTQETAGYYRAPKLCAPDSGERDTGDACFADDDCKSGTCYDTGTECADDTCGEEESCFLDFCTEVRLEPGTCD